MEMGIGWSGIGIEYGFGKISKVNQEIKIISYHMI